MNKFFKLFQEIESYKSLILLCLLAMPLSILAQDPVSLSGKIQGSVIEEVEFIYDPTYLDEEPIIEKYELQDGVFHGKLNIDKASIVKMRYNGQAINLYLKPGDDLDINIGDANALTKEIVFLGSAGANNTFLLEFNQEFETREKLREIKEKTADSSIDPLEIYLFDRLYAQKTMLKKTDLSLSDNFKSYINTQAKYCYLSNLLNFPIVKVGYAKDRRIYPLPSVITDELDKVSLDSRTAMLAPHYRDFLQSYINYTSAVENENSLYPDDDTDLVKRVYTSRKILQNNQVAYTIAKYMLDGSESASSSALKDAYTALQKVDSDKAFAPMVMNRLSEKLNSSEEEAVASSESKEDMLKEIAKDLKKLEDENDPSFKMTGLEGDKVKLTAYEGKVVYIDFWASWCGPCIGQMKHAKKLKESLTAEQKEKITFLYISIDNNEKTWKSAIERMDISGEHLLSEGGWQSEAAEEFGLKSIPRYMIMNEKGEIVNFNAPRPSSQEILPALLDLIK